MHFAVFRRHRQAPPAMVAAGLSMFVAAMAAAGAALAQLPLDAPPADLVSLPPEAPAWAAVVGMLLSQVTRDVLQHRRASERSRGQEAKLDTIYAALIEESSDGSRISRLRAQHDEFIRRIADSAEREATAGERTAELLAKVCQRMEDLEELAMRNERLLLEHHSVAAGVAADLRGQHHHDVPTPNLDDTAIGRIGPRRRRTDRD